MDNTMYNFSDEDELEDAILNRAMDRWEQMGGGGATGGPLFNFSLKPIGKRRQWRNVVQRQQFDAELRQMRQPEDGDNIGQALTEALYRSIARELERQNRPPHHFINFAITANAFQHAYQSINFSVGEFLERRARLDELLQKMAAKLNSNESFNPSNGFQVDVVFVRMPGRGTGSRGKKNNPGQSSLQKMNKKKKSIISIKNDDKLCCARAIVTMRAHCHKNEGSDGHRNWENTKRGLPVQQRLAQELHRQAGVPEGSCGLPELQKFQAALGPQYQLLVMARMKPFFLIFKGPSAPHQIHLLKSNSHFDGCTSFPAFRNRSYFCVDCEKAFNTNDKAHHSCKGKRCQACARFNCPDYVPGTRPGDYCSHCNTNFYGASCKHHHFQNKQCQSFKTCTNCQGQYMVVKGKRHRCGYAKCPVCQKYVSINHHKCFIQPVAEEEEKPEATAEGEGCMVAPPPPLFVYADLEAMQNAEGVFVPNLLCYSSSEEESIHVLDGEDCTLQFLHDLDDLVDVQDNEQQRKVTVVFHNLKGFDGIFIINKLYDQQRPVEKQLTIGAKVLSFKSGPLRFIDSLCFLPMPLAAFSATFNLTELKKGFFPHLFNTPDNQQYVGRIPDIEFYDPDSMMSSKKEELLNWHAKQLRLNVQFNFKQELIHYCKSDVQLLKQGCEAFQQEFEREAGFNPMAECFTIASACNLYWRKKHLLPNTIAVEPLRGWRGANVNQSLKALQWLYFQEEQIPKQGGASQDRIKHLRNGGEQTVRTSTNIYFVDGFDSYPKTVYEFYGCFFHGCPTCYPVRDVKHYAAPDRTVQERFNATEAKRMALLRAGFKVIEIWECQWEQQVDTNPSVQNFLASFDLVAPLQPRDTFYGGRTGAVSLHAVPGEGEEIRYVDITSLYPWVNKNGTYPVGHPTIITQPLDQRIQSYFGLALVDVLPPSSLFHPVLPVRQGGKLTFPLCRSCVEKEQAKPMLQRTHYCIHSDVERMLRGSWCTPELVKAVQKGYQIIKIHEVWNFPPQQRQTGLFKDYVDTWLKTKQEATGWPSWCQSLEQKRNYIMNYQEREGIRLDIASIQNNPGRKATAKLMLNWYLFHVAFFFHVVVPPLLISFFFSFFISCSFWGKFGEKLKKPTTVTVTQPSHLFNLITDTTKEISTIRICTEDILEAVYTDVQENAPKGSKTNIFVAAFTTSYARLKLYESLDLLQQQVLYYDTDSIIYKWKQGQQSIAIGDMLGEWKDELNGDSITEFVSGGPKNYAYQTRGGNSVCKVRGFTLNVRDSASLNFQSMKRNILEELNIPQDSRRNLNIVTPYHFQRDVEKKQIRVVPRVKKYGLVFDKRVINTNAVSYPYGYRRIGEEIDLLMEL